MTKTIRNNSGINFPSEDFLTILSSCPFNVVYSANQIPNPVAYNNCPPLLKTSGLLDPRRQNPVLSNAITNCSYDPTKPPEKQDCVNAYFIITGLPDNRIPDFFNTASTRVMFSPIAASDTYETVRLGNGIDENGKLANEYFTMKTLVESALKWPLTGIEELTLTFNVGWLMNDKY